MEQLFIHCVIIKNKLYFNFNNMIEIKGCLDSSLLNDGEEKDSIKEIIFNRCIISEFLFFYIANVKHIFINLEKMIFIECIYSPDNKYKCHDSENAWNSVVGNIQEMIRSRSFPKFKTISFEECIHLKSNDERLSDDSIEEIQSICVMEPVNEDFALCFNELATDSDVANSLINLIFSKQTEQNIKLIIFDKSQITSNVISILNEYSYMMPNITTISLHNCKKFTITDGILKNTKCPKLKNLRINDSGKKLISYSFVK